MISEPSLEIKTRVSLNFPRPLATMGFLHKKIFNNDHKFKTLVRFFFLKPTPTKIASLFFMQKPLQFYYLLPAFHDAIGLKFESEIAVNFRMNKNYTLFKVLVVHSI